MSLAVLGLVLTAAVAHAGWNFMAKGAEGGAAFVWLGAVAGSLIYLPALALALVVAPGQLGWAAIGCMAGSGVLHAVYFTLLQRGYAAGDLSFVYPLARGTGPLLSTAAGIVILAERPSAMAIAGATIARTRSGTSRPSARPRSPRSSTTGAATPQTRSCSPRGSSAVRTGSGPHGRPRGAVRPGSASSARSRTCSSSTRSRGRRSATSRRHARRAS